MLLDCVHNFSFKPSITKIKSEGNANKRVIDQNKSVKKVFDSYVGCKNILMQMNQKKKKAGICWGNFNSLL